MQKQQGKFRFSKKITFSLLFTVIFSVLVPIQLLQANSFADLFGKSSTNNRKILPVHEAFSVTTEQKNHELLIYFDVKDGYYLYQDKIKLNLPENVTAEPLKFSIQSEFVDDPDFGRVPVFDKSFTASTTLSANSSVPASASVVKWQGCAKAGLCYPPEQTNFTLQALSVTQAPIAVSENNINDNLAEKETSTHQNQSIVNDNKPQTTSDISANLADNKETVLQTNQQTPDNTTTANNPSILADNLIPETTNINTSQELAVPVQADNQTDANSTTVENVNVNSNTVVENTNSQSLQTTSSLATAPFDPKLLNEAPQDPFGLLNHTWLALLLLFLAGLGLAFTPCVLPMLPIVANIVARQHNPSAKKGLLLTGGYGLGVAVSYGLMGTLIAIFGQSLGIMNWLQNPMILLSFAGLFVLLGFYMLDMLPVRLPAKLAIKLQGLTQVGENRLGSVTGSFITGFFSALVVSPCVSAPLAGALAGVATLGNPIIGFFALFMLGLGLSTPLILLGATQGNFMPKAGEWMVWVKTGFALLMFAVALLMLERVFVSSLMLAIWALWFAVVAVWAWQWAGRGQIFTKAVSMILSIWTACLLVGVGLGSKDNWQPLKSLTASSNNQTSKQNYITVTKLDELTPIIQSQPNVLVDVTATWCIECRIMDKTLFANPPAELQNWYVVKLDVTENNANSRAVYQALQVAGPPVLLYFQQGKLVKRQNGEVKRPEFEQALANL